MTVDYTAKNDLINDMVQSMMESVNDDPKNSGFWRIIPTNGIDVLHVTTRFSRDPSRSNNGGDYYEYRMYSIQDSGVLAINDWSCDIEPMSRFGNDCPTLYRIDVEDLSPIVESAEKIVKSVLAGEKEPAFPACGRHYK